MSEEILPGKPIWTPVHKTPVWLSQMEVEEAVKAVVEKRGNSAKAVGWDILVAIARLAERPPHD